MSTEEELAIKTGVAQIKALFPNLSDYEALMTYHASYANVLFEQAFMSNSEESIFHQIFDESSSLRLEELDILSAKLDKLLSLNVGILKRQKYLRARKKVEDTSEDLLRKNAEKNR